MLSGDQIQQLKSENELLQLQLQDVNYMIKVREEELEILREKATQAVEVQSRLVENLYEIEQMQNNLGIQQQLSEGAALREAALEEEMIQSIQTEKDFYEIKKHFSSTQAELNMINDELATSADWYKQLILLKARVTELESNLEIALLDNSSLKEELDKYREEKALSTKNPE